MANTTQCPQCGVVLTLPPGALGRRLRCPHCGTKFSSDQAGARPPSSAPGVAEAGTASSLISPSPGAADQVVPRADGDLRETFDLPMMMEEDKPAAPRPKSRSNRTADATTLFKDDSAPKARRRSAAEDRRQARKCPTCGNVVPTGMSLCDFCGLDLDTGQRSGLEDEAPDLADGFDSAPETSRVPPLPAGIVIIGGMTFVGSVILTIVASIFWLNGKEGFEFLALVCLFGIFASVQFLRRSSTKPLLVALTLGALIDVVALIALPVYRANEDTSVQPAAVASGDGLAANNEDETEGPAIKPYIDRLEYNSVALGITLLVAYAALVLFLLSPPVSRHFGQVRQARLP